MSRKRRSFGGSFNAKVALAACRGEKTTAQLAAEFGVHAGQVTAWKKQLLEGAAGLFEDGRSKRAVEDTANEEELYEQIGRLKMEVEWLKRKLPSSAEQLRRCIEPDHKQLSIVRQCALVGLAHSTWYYRPAGESAENLALMRAIDEQYLRMPFYGSRKLAKMLGVNRKRVQRLMRVMGIEAIYPQRRTTWPGARHKIYPYLRRNVEATRPDQVLDRTVHSCGTSNTTALATRCAAIAYERVDSLLKDYPDVSLDEDTIPAVLKTITVHAACWNNAGDTIDRLFGPIMTDWRELQRFKARLLGFGEVQPARCLFCTDQRVTMLGWGRIDDGLGQTFTIPLPRALSASRIKRRLTVTLGWLTPIIPGIATIGSHISGLTYLRKSLASESAM